MHHNRRNSETSTKIALCKILEDPLFQDQAWKFANVRSSRRRAKALAKPESQSWHSIRKILSTRPRFPGSPSEQPPPSQPTPTDADQPSPSTDEDIPPPIPGITTILSWNAGSMTPERIMRLNNMIQEHHADTVLIQETMLRGESPNVPLTHH